MRLRAHMVQYLVKSILEEARGDARRAKKYRERFKYDCIGAKGKLVKRNALAVTKLDEEVVALCERLSKRVEGFKWASIDLAKVCDPATWAEAAEGAAKGSGMPGYDTEENIERARKRVAAQNMKAIKESKPAPKKAKKSRSAKKAVKGQGGLF